MRKLNQKTVATVRERERESYNSKREKIIETGRHKACPYNEKENINITTELNKNADFCRGTEHRARIENGTNIKFISIIKNAQTTVGAGLDSAHEHEREKIIDKTGTMHRAPTGITLISLILTIIVLLILAGVSLNFVFGENGILKHAEFASNKYENKVQIEQNELAQLDDYISNGRNNDIKSGVEYSLQETKTQDTWMGKPIYTKTIYINSLPNATSTDYAHNIENAETIWIDSGESFFIEQSNMSVTVPAGHISNIAASVIVYADTAKIKINTGNLNRNVWKAYITLKYTKTTD